MDTGHTYASNGLSQIAIYAPDGFTAPPKLTLEWDGEPVVFFLLADAALSCGQVHGVTGKCSSYECHRTELGKCVCGRHPEGVRLGRAA